MIGKNIKLIELIGDKGYIINENSQNLLKNLNTTMITPTRKNQKKQNTDDEKNKLKKRYKVENTIATIKRYNRIHIRRDKLMINYMGFVYLACIKVAKK